MEIWDESKSSDLIIYKFKIGYLTYLAEMTISTSKLLTLRDFDRYMQDLPDDEILVGELEYNRAIKYLREQKLII